MPRATERPLTPRFGAHMSIAGGLHRAIDLAEAAGCDCVQVFVKNQRQWSARPLRDDEIAAWHAAQQRTGIAPAIAHATYLINLASPDNAIWQRSIAACADELRRCSALRIRGLVIHPGAHMGCGEAAGCRRVADALRIILDEFDDPIVRPLLEITAGQGTCLGHRLEHLAGMIDRSGRPERIGICFDTCHALAAGYRFDTDETYAATFDELDRRLGIARIECFHLNDSRRECGSRVDRHTHVGEGYVGRSAFRRIVTDPRFRNVPMILETPKGTDNRGRDLDRINLQRLRRLARPAPPAPPRPARRAASARR